MLSECAKITAAAPVMPDATVEHIEEALKTMETVWDERRHLAVSTQDDVGRALNHLRLALKPIFPIRTESEVRNAALERAEMIARQLRERWSCAGGFGGHSAAARIIADEIHALKTN